MESTNIETMPIDLVATEDGQTFFAVTGHKDGVLEIVATPVTVVGQSGMLTPLMDVKNLCGNLILQSPVFQISVENVGGSEFELPGQNIESSGTVFEQMKSDLSIETKQVAKDTFHDQSLFNKDISNNGSNEQSSGQRSAETTATEILKKNSPGRPKKSARISLQDLQSFKCDICHQVFAKQTLYRKHMENHAEEKPHRCPKCSASFNIPTNFTLHMATHNTGEPKCPECGRKFARMASLKSHMLLHEKEENLFCTECEDAFSTKAQLDAHLKLHGEKWTTEEARKCKLCNKQFSQPALYRLHIREHYRLQTKVVRQTKRGTKHKTMYKCTICLKSFQKPSQLMRHIRVHTGEKPFKCTVCGRAFTQKSSLQIHTWQHNGVRPHTCELCNAKFSQKGNLNVHIMRVHNIPEGEPIYGCNYCSCVFKKLGSLNGHMKRMHTNVNEGNLKEPESTDDMESDIRATVDSVMTQLASLEAESNIQEPIKSPNFNQPMLPEVVTKKDILQQALKNSGLPSKNKFLNEGTTMDTKSFEARTNFVTLLDRATDGDTRKYLTIKQRCVGNVWWYACTFCHKEFKKPSDLIRHLRVHTQEKPFKCTYCYRSFALKSTMVAHERTHVGTKKYACGACDKTFACHGSLVAHLRVHAKSDERTDKLNANGENNISTCTATEICSVNEPRIQAKSKSKLLSEVECLVPQVVLQEPLIISDTGNRICVAQVPSKEKRTRDAATDPARPHKCWVCHAAFRKISHLKQHHRRHTGERPYKCTKCDRTFASNSVLKSHLHTHDDLRPYGCSICNTKFSTQSSMKRHLVTHSNKRPFMCPYCHKTFKTYVNCRKHMKIHKQELAQRQLDQQKVTLQPIVNKSDLNENIKSATILEAPCYVTDNSSAATTTADILDKPASSTFSDSVTLSRLGPVEISFQPQIGAGLSQAFSDQFQTIANEKEKTTSILQTNSTTSTIVNQNISETAVTGIDSSEVLQADGTNLVYSGDQTFTPESIREIEETLNQQIFNIDMNLNLEGNHSRHLNGTNTSDLRNPKQQQPILNIIYEGNDDKGNNPTNSNSTVEPASEHIFASPLDSFEMDHIALQSDTEIDIGLDTNNAASATSTLDRTAKEEHRFAVSITTADNVDDNEVRSSCMRTIVLIPEKNISEKESITNELEVEETGESISQTQRSVSSVLLTSETEGETEHSKILSKERTLSSDISNANETFRRESLLQCHMCSQQGFTAISLKEHLKTHRGVKGYRCTDCSSTFCTNGGLNRHSKIHVNKYNVSENISIVSEKMQMDSANSRLNDIIVDSDSTVSEKVLLDTVAEKEVMDQLNDIKSASVRKRERKEYTNKCKYCPKTFRKPSDLVRHVRTHTGERPYKCDYCSKSFAVKCTLDSHTKVHTGKKTFRCHVCSSLFATKGSLKVHMRLHTGSKPFKCSICDSRFRTSGHRKVHLLKHAREHKNNPKRKQKHLKVAAIAEVAADFEKRVENESNISEMEQDQQHEPLLLSPSRTTTTSYSQFGAISVETPSACLTDQITFNTESTAPNNNPLLSVSEGNQLVANLHFFLTNGLVTIQTEETLLPHLTQSNAGDANRRPIIASEPVRMPMLDIGVSGDNNDISKEAILLGQTASKAQSSSPYQLQSNNCLLTIATSTQVESLPKLSLEKSPSLSKKEATKGNLSKKECNVCGKTFTKPYQVERHKRIHTGERPYKCDLCSKSFAQKSTLQMHQKHHTGDRPYLCPYCEYSFTQKGNLRTHMKRVHQLDSVDIKKLKPSFTKSFQENLTVAKAFNLDEASFIEFLK